VDNWVSFFGRRILEWTEEIGDKNSIHLCSRKIVKTFKEECAATFSRH
jgi:hypothetical protein